MKTYRTFVLLAFFLVTISVQAQNEKSSSSSALPDEFNIAQVEQKPEFPGGDAALFKYLSDSIRYPVDARTKGIKGKVILSFVISKDGSVDDIVLLRGIGGGCDEESIRVVKSMPKWTPGRHKGNPVKVKYTLPINFTF